MRKFLLPLLISLVTFNAQAADEAEACLTPDTDYLAMEFNAFDQTREQGWREVADREGCELAAADLIKTYYMEHSDLSKGRLGVLRWHEGQMRAEAAQYEQAVALFNQTYKDPENDSFGWNYYVTATIAFIEKDKEKLLEARELLAAVEKPSSLNMTDAEGNPVEMRWPPNLHIVDNYVACFGKTYLEAYSTQCTSSSSEE